MWTTEAHRALLRAAALPRAWVVAAYWWQLPPGVREVTGTMCLPRVGTTPPSPSGNAG